MFYFVFVAIIICTFYLGVLIYRKNPNGRDNKLFLGLIFWLVIWLAANFLENEPFRENFRIFFLYIDFLIAPIWGFFWFLFCYSFLENKKLSKFKNHLFVGFITFLIVSIFLDLIIYGINAQEAVIKFKFGLLFPLYAIFILFTFIGGSIIIYFKYRRFKGVKKIQALYTLTGFLLTSVLVTTINLFFQEKTSVEVFRLVNFSFIFLIGFTSYAIIRYHLFDIRSIIQKGIIYSALLGVIIVFYLAIVVVIGYFFQRTANTTILISAGLTLLIGMFGLSGVEKFFRKVTDKIFFKDKYDYKESVQRLSELLNNNLGLEKLLGEAMDELSRILKTEKIVVHLFEQDLVYDENKLFRKRDEVFSDISLDNKKIFLLKSSIRSSEILLLTKQKSQRKKVGGLDKEACKSIGEIAKKYNIELFVPIATKEKAIGALLLGEKKSGDIFTDEDVRLVETFANQSAVAIKRAELYGKIKDYSKNLETKVVERTRKIKSMQEAQKNMILDISHNLLTPLTVVKAELGLLERKNGAHAESYKNFEGSVDKVSKFVYDMLNFSQLEANSEIEKKEEVDLSKLIKSEIEFVKGIALEKKVKISSSIESDIFLLGSEEKLSDMINNFLTNAIKYSDDKKKYKRIDVELSKKGNKITLKIKDNGIGVDKKNLKKLFNRFFREKRDVGVKGTGLGLSICKKIAEMHGATISVESLPEEGSEFIIVFG